MLQGDITATPEGLMTNNPQKALQDEWNKESKLLYPTVTYGFCHPHNGSLSTDVIQLQ